MSAQPSVTKKLYYGDNLPLLREQIADESVDLICLDPPFNKNRAFNVLFSDDEDQESESQVEAFSDSWEWTPVAEATYQDLLVGGRAKASARVSATIDGLHSFLGNSDTMAYIVMMAVRLVELHRKLKPTGTLFLHCDPTMSAYLGLVLDAIFEPCNRRAEIIWKRTSSHNSVSRRAGHVHDEILFYSKSDDYTWNRLYQPYDKAYLDQCLTSELDGRRYHLCDLTEDAVDLDGEEGNAWRGVDPAEQGLQWAVPDDLIEELGIHDETIQRKLDALDRLGLISWPDKAGGAPMYKHYLNERSVHPLDDLWTDIPPIGAHAAERLGFPTQKPLALLERILSMSSNPGDLVLDPFSGCGTTIAAAQGMGRGWIGIDITSLAVALMKNRLKDMYGLKPNVDYQVVGEPQDLDGARQLALDDRDQFQWWALSLVGGRPLEDRKRESTGKKGANRGVDGVVNFVDDRSKRQKRALVQVKSGNVEADDIRDLRGTVEREHAALGIFITLGPATSEMMEEAASAGFYHSLDWGRDYPKIQILTIDDLIHVKKKLEMPGTKTTFKQVPRANLSEAKQGELGF